MLLWAVCPASVSKQRLLHSAAEVTHLEHKAPHGLITQRPCCSSQLEALHDPDNIEAVSLQAVSLLNPVRSLSQAHLEGEAPHGLVTQRPCCRSQLEAIQNAGLHAVTVPLQGCLIAHTSSTGTCLEDKAPHGLVAQRPCCRSQLEALHDAGLRAVTVPLERRFALTPGLRRCARGVLVSSGGSHAHQLRSLP